MFVSDIIMWIPFLDMPLYLLSFLCLEWNKSIVWLHKIYNVFMFFTLNEYTIYYNTMFSGRAFALWAGGQGFYFGPPPPPKDVIKWSPYFCLELTNKERVGLGLSFISILVKRIRRIPCGISEREWFIHVPV